MFHPGGRYLIKLGDKEVEYNPEFHFYITTKLSNPHYTPEISTKTTIVNFAVKEQGQYIIVGVVFRESLADRFGKDAVTFGESCLFLFGGGRLLWLVWRCGGRCFLGLESITFLGVRMGGGAVTFGGLVVAYCGVGVQVFFWSLSRYVFFVGRGVVTIFDPFFWGGVGSHYFRDFILLFAKCDGSWFVSKLTVVSYCSY